MKNNRIILLIVKILISVAILYLLAPPESNASIGYFHPMLLQCSPSLHKEGGLCQANTKSCSISNGSGTQTWNGSSYGSCTLASCNSGYTASGNSCIIADQCAGSNPTLGSVCPDGSIFVGIVSGTKYYVPHKNQSSNLYVTSLNWGVGRLYQNAPNCSYDTLYRDSLFGFTYTFPPTDGTVVQSHYLPCAFGGGTTTSAMDICSAGTFHGKSDWYLPTKSELTKLFVGGLTVGAVNSSGASIDTTSLYWTADQNTNNGWYEYPFPASSSFYAMNPQTGAQSLVSMNTNHPFFCLRKE